MNKLQVEWTEKQIGELDGKIAIVTGGNSGVGYETVKMLARAGADVIATVRSIEKGEQLLESLRELKLRGSVNYELLDLASRESIWGCAQSINEKNKAIDILVNNAGVMNTGYELTEDGIELQQGTNYFGHFLLTALLFDSLKRSNNARIVNVSSLAYVVGRMNFNNLMYTNRKGYSPIRAYSRSKLENLLFTKELTKKLHDAEISNIKVVSAHPGVSATNLSRYSDQTLFYKILTPFLKKFAQSSYMGALPVARAATDITALSEEFYGPNKFFGIQGSPVSITPIKSIVKAEDAQKLWEYSEELMGIKFNI